MCTIRQCLTAVRIVALVAAVFTPFGLAASWDEVGSYESNANSKVGGSVTLSPDGQSLAVCARGISGVGDIGIHVLFDNGAQWVQRGSTISLQSYPPETVSISGDGLTVAVGSSSGFGNGGFGYWAVFRFEQNSWTTYDVEIGDNLGDRNLLGSAIALSDDGLIVAIGSMHENTLDGVVRVYRDNGSNFRDTQLGPSLIGAASGTGETFGNALSMSKDGTILAVGARQYSNGNNRGAVYVYEYNDVDNLWEALGSPIIGEGESDYCGESVSLSANATILAVGCPGNQGSGTTGNEERGRVRIFRRSGQDESSNWVQVGQSIDGTQDYQKLGTSVVISQDGTYLAISGNPAQAGSVPVARVFRLELTSDEWLSVANEVSINQLGSTGTSKKDAPSVSIASGGSVLALGSPLANDRAGQVRILAFNATGSASNPSTSPTTSSPSASPTTSSPSASPTTSSPSTNPGGAENTSSPSASPTKAPNADDDTTAGPESFSPSHSPTSAPSIPSGSDPTVMIIVGVVVAVILFLLFSIITIRSKRQKQGRGSTLPVPHVPSFKYDVFLTHNWGKDENGRDNHARVSALNKKLRSLKVKTWFDEERLTGRIDRLMAKGVEQSKKIVACITEKYESKVDSELDDNCAKEFLHASAHRKPNNMIAVVMEPRMLKRKWTGVLGVNLVNHLYLDYTEDRMLDEVARSIKEELYDPNEINL